eukprot:gnl/TRDRNA2_/TRDRNA2_169850_c0_seq1.p1 gnl/TRDRNA2_/TRDRNA2_169850_c0~~gnl/TRDRNA2_/TRDRNA2_169850_c0_seq1.p1  ORF type:complete len:236 (-),score=14.13 gnl/TRDRNA2_/TRDRNA2_169850_c0_seq1:440-1147(-)
MGAQACRKKWISGRCLFHSEKDGHCLELQQKLLPEAEDQHQAQYAKAANVSQAVSKAMLPAERSTIREPIHRAATTVSKASAPREFVSPSDPVSYQLTCEGDGSTSSKKAGSPDTEQTPSSTAPTVVCTKEFTDVCVAMGNSASSGDARTLTDPRVTTATDFVSHPVCTCKVSSDRDATPHPSHVAGMPLQHGSSRFSQDQLSEMDAYEVEELSMRRSRTNPSKMRRIPTGSDSD